jgi:hypothetical protein
VKKVEPFSEVKKNEHETRQNTGVRDVKMDIKHVTIQAA